MSTFADALNGQVGYEFAASQQYVAIAAYYDAQTLPQLAAHFYRQAVEERNHAMMMVQYLLDADEEVASMTELLAVVERGKDNLLHVEEHLSRAAGGENPLEAGAPPAAGGAL